MSETVVLWVCIALFLFTAILGELHLRRSKALLRRINEGIEEYKALAREFDERYGDAE